MNARLLLSVLFLGAFALAFYLIFSLWPHEEPEPEYAPDLQHEAMVAVAEVHEWIAANTTTTTSSTTTTTTMPRARTAPTRPARTVRVQSVGDLVDRLAACESGMNPRAYNPAGPYYSFFQWAMSTWRQAGGPGHPFDAPYGVQKRLAMAWAKRTSWASQWPVCSRKVGLASKEVAGA